jgi:hypothetical protein
MDFGQATTKLTADVTLKDLARETGYSHALFRLSRLDPSNPSFRNPPQGWERAVLRLARRRLDELTRLIDRLSREAPRASARKAASPAKRRNTGRGSKAKRPRAR